MRIGRWLGIAVLLALLPGAALPLLPGRAAAQEVCLNTLFVESPAAREPLPACDSSGERERISEVFSIERPPVAALPADWGHRGGRLAAQALAGVACTLLVMSTTYLVRRGGH